MKDLRAMIFDMDGTLVATELLKAQSYAAAAVHLSGGAIDPGEVIEAYRELVGQSREVVASSIMLRFGLERAARERMKREHADSPVDALISIRLRDYHQRITNDGLIKSRERRSIVDVLRIAREHKLLTALVTVSHRDQVDRIVRVLELGPLLDLTIAREDVRQAKPDPEVYERVIARLGVRPEQCVALEDSLSGIRAALDAGTHCLGVPNEFTRESVLSSRLLPAEWIARDDEEIKAAAHRLLGDVETMARDV